MSQKGPRHTSVMALPAHLVLARHDYGGFYYYGGCNSLWTQLSISSWAQHSQPVMLKSLPEWWRVTRTMRLITHGPKVVAILLKNMKWPSKWLVNAWIASLSVSTSTALLQKCFKLTFIVSLTLESSQASLPMFPFKGSQRLRHLANMIALPDHWCILPCHHCILSITCELRCIKFLHFDCASCYFMKLCSNRRYT